MGDHRIIVDHREHAEELVATLTGTHGFEVEAVQLELGDYLIPPATLVERKTTRDFNLSILDGRLFDQAYRLAGAIETPVMLVEGKSFLGTDINLSTDAIKGALASLAQSYGIPVLRSRDQIDSAWYLACLYGQSTRMGTHLGPRHGRRAKRLSARKLRLVRALPGIGPKLGKTLIEHFGSLQAIFSADHDSLCAIPGLGPKRAEEIRSVLRESDGEYRIARTGA